MESRGRRARYRRRIQTSHLSAFIIFLLGPRLVVPFSTMRNNFHFLSSREPTGPFSSELFGFRSTVREKLSSLQRISKRRRLDADHHVAPPVEDPTIVVPLKSKETVEVAEPAGESNSFSAAAGVIIASSDEAEIQQLYLLPPLGDRRLTKLELEFRNMLADFAHFSPHDIESLRDPRMRVLFEGVAASAGCRPVYRAFEILYEDLYPLRVAGRMVYARLQQLMVDSQRERDEEVDSVIKETRLERHDVEATRLSFVSVAARLNGDSFLTREQLRETGLAATAVDVLGFESVDDLLDLLCKDELGKTSFMDMMIGLQKTAESVCGIEQCNPAEVMSEIMQELREHPPTARTNLDRKRQQYSDHYDGMLASFREWESLVPLGDGRRLDVVRGCFVGAKNRPVVEALRVVYVDYAALRVAGDIIFKLVKGVMSAAANRQRRLNK